MSNNAEWVDYKNWQFFTSIFIFIGILSCFWIYLILWEYRAKIHLEIANINKIIKHLYIKHLYI